jgi:hypothetical protein
LLLNLQLYLLLLLTRQKLEEIATVRLLLLLLDWAFWPLLAWLEGLLGLLLRCKL